ncbi:glycosyltransferase family 32 protein [Salegentibacter agarivorans]|nr:glycosyltransferase [Salegentibacter agarivorans]
MELINNPLISCICVSVEDSKKLKKSISQFISQTYDQKELIIVFKDFNGKKKKLLNKYHNYNIFGFELNCSIDQMFDYGFSKINGRYICIWEETNWYHAAKIQYQYHAIVLKKMPICLVNYIVLFDSNQEKAYISAKKLWLETLMCEKKELLRKRYSNLNDYLEEIFEKSNKIFLINDVPNLQIKTVNENLSIEEQKEIKQHSYQLNESDSQFIGRLVKKNNYGENDSLKLDSTLENPIFDTLDEEVKLKKIIPKIIHITYKEKKVPEKFQKTYQSIKTNHPDWDIKFYDDSDIKHIIQKEFPILLKIYESYPINIQRIDLFRVLIVYLKGGFYLDLDMHSFKSLNELCSFDLVLAEEIVYTKPQDKRFNFTGIRQIGNYMFGSKPKHPFWVELIKEMINRCDQKIIHECDVLESTGPGVLSDVFFEKQILYSNVKILKNKFKRCHSGCPAVCCHFGDFAAHLHVNSWTWTNKTINKPENDFSSSISKIYKKEVKLSLDSLE